MLLSYSAACWALLACAHATVWAQAGLVKPANPPQAASSAAPGSNDEPPAEDSPRSTLEDFFKLAHNGHYADAAKYLDLPATETNGPKLAAHLTYLLDRYAWSDRDTASAAPGGDPDDGLPPGIDEVGKVPGAHGDLEPVRLVRRGPAGARWLFSRVTTQRIDDWYDALPHRWLIELAPEPLLRMGPANLLWAQWCTVPIFLLLVWWLGSALSQLGRRLVRPWLSHTRIKWGRALLAQLERPITFTGRLLVAWSLLPFLGLYAPAALFASRSIRALLLATFFWALARSVDVAGQTFAGSQWGQGEPSARALLSFGSRFGKFVVACFAVVALFSELGYPVTSLIAGLGVGGIAVALAAQKTLENLFGAFAITIDQPFREGDIVKVDGFLGSVEVIGMRSTRFRTGDRTLITIPNGKLSEMRLETFAARDRIFWGFTFALSYQTSEAQMREILSGTEALLRNHPKMWPNDISVRFKEFGDAGLLVELNAYLNLTDYNAFTLIRQDLLLALMALVEHAGAKFATPRRAITIAETKPTATPP